MIYLKTDNPSAFGIEGDRILTLTAPPQGAEVIDLTGLCVFPGLIDIHVHGGAGFDVMDGTPAALDAISAFKIKEGVTSFCPTTVTASEKQTSAAIANIKNAVARGVGGAKIIGAFMEGPFINPRYKGAHPQEFIREIDLRVLTDWIAYGIDTIRSVAIAPELPGALDAIRMLRENNLNVRLGHSDATFEETTAGIQAGGNIAIHTYNAMRPFLHRDSGMTGAVLVNGDIYNEIICDFIHTDETAVRLLYNAKSAEKIILVTDCMCAGGMADGEYLLGAVKVFVKDGIARTESGALAGSTLNLLQSIKNIHVRLGVPPAQAVQMATETPAKALGLFDEIGSLDIGKKADVIALDSDLNLKFVMVDGNIKMRIK